MSANPSTGAKGCVLVFFGVICVICIASGGIMAWVIGVPSGFIFIGGLMNIYNGIEQNKEPYAISHNTIEKSTGKHSYFQWKHLQLCLPPHDYILEDFVNIVEENGIIRVFEKDFSKVEKVAFGISDNIYRLRYEKYRVSFSPLFEISCLLPGAMKKEFRYNPNIDGLFHRTVSIGQENINEGKLLMFIDTRKNILEEWDKMMEQKKKERAEEREKQQIAEKLKERHRKRELEKMIQQELIDRGEIMPVAKRPPIPKDIANAVYRRDGGRCVYCGSVENLQFDHIIPFSKGGATTIENLQLLCQKCNLEKSNHIG